MNVILILPLPLLCLLSPPHFSLRRCSPIFSSLALFQRSCQTKASSSPCTVDVAAERSICAWHLPNGDGLSGSSLCLSMSNWHTYEQTHAGGCLSSAVPPPPPPLSTSGPPWGPFKQRSCGGSLLADILWAISCTSSQTLSGRIKHNWPSGLEE